MDTSRLYDDKQIAGKVISSVDITNEFITYIMIGAIEGAISYWADYIDVPEEYWAKYKSDEDACFSEIAAEVILDGKALTITDEDGTYELNLEKLLQGIKLFFDLKGVELDTGNIDAYGFDAIIQYSIFGRLVYS